MKLATKLNPKRLLSSKKTRSLSRSDLPSFGSGSSSSEPGKATPQSVLPSISSETLGDWSEVSAETHLELSQAFKMIDKDGDGKITRGELEAVLRRVGAEPLSEEEMASMLGDIDVDGDGCISLAEFGAMGPAFSPPACDSELRDAFDVFDADQDGRITAEELRVVFAAIGDERCTLEDCRRMISGVDKNGNGFVCFEDFARMMDWRR
ncbi:probable calcium-binding protein CML36 [Diospyros lotus]|uniref:probable calcium-binding protein CML36 n=1 Tax=Diospyros lotus TaxID=55363 RepID=UPI00225126B5|nr:probable calcium-binding protein CML36 [Diospyros lotus]